MSPHHYVHYSVAAATILPLPYVATPYTKHLLPTRRTTTPQSAEIKFREKRQVHRIHPPCNAIVLVELHLKIFITLAGYMSLVYGLFPNGLSRPLCRYIIRQKICSSALCRFFFNFFIIVLFFLKVNFFFRVRFEFFFKQQQKIDILKSHVCAIAKYRLVFHLKKTCRHSRKTI